MLPAEVSLLSTSIFLYYVNSLTTHRVVEVYFFLCVCVCIFIFHSKEHDSRYLLLQCVSFRKLFFFKLT